MNTTIAACLSLVVSLGTLAGCAVTAAPPAGGVAKPSSAASKPKTEAKADGLRSKAGGSTPPAGATVAGKQTRPTVGVLIIPIVDVEVYTFEFDFNGDDELDTVFWAHVDGGSTYLWASGPITCSDGSSDGDGGFSMEIEPDGSGAYLFATEQCPTDNHYGCEFDASGRETTCGACAINDTHFACVAASQ